ncbi:PIG-L deacetylase family protein [Paenibacillus alginolyticus]|uniref:PIG-L family deacetylase n=1 Tax=Paenibacillus alginolyticus TaxID=59839 RepID=A0ABT4GLR3_9BACL|nr:PIG-L family deacetylase [Paenibacillus alginolyticus]MCY9696963.1 PIG-L family deacetylase [Paenibacillus alginolyticus]MEC0147349.1 PIG-L family deacetylase [Paenibacillus alginolyticus]
MKHQYGFIYAHPDDETFLSACIIRKLADQGENPVLLLATRGDAGRQGLERATDRSELAKLREKEMDEAAKVLGLSHVEHLGWPDGQLAEIDFNALVEGVIAFIQQYEVEVLFTFPEDGGNGHPDHITISKATTAAVLSGKCPSVRKLYYAAAVSLRAKGHKPSIELDTEAGWPIKAAALRAHATQHVAIAKYFGDIDVFPEDRRWEAFVLGWQDGTMWPEQDLTNVLEE